MSMRLVCIKYVLIWCVYGCLGKCKYDLVYVDDRKNRQESEMLDTEVRMLKEALTVVAFYCQ
jgi:hypothetical protein